MTIADILGDLYNGGYRRTDDPILQSRQRYVQPVFSPSKLLDLAQAKYLFGGGTGLSGKETTTSSSTTSGSSNTGGPPGFSPNTGTTSFPNGAGSLGGTGSGSAAGANITARAMPGYQDYDPRSDRGGLNLNDLLQQLINSQAFGY